MPAPKSGRRRLERMVAIVAWGPLVRLLVLLGDLAHGCKVAEGLGVVTVLQSCSPAWQEHPPAIPSVGRRAEYRSAVAHLVGSL